MLRCASQCYVGQVPTNDERKFKECHRNLENSKYVWYSQHCRSLPLSPYNVSPHSLQLTLEVNNTITTVNYDLSNAEVRNFRMQNETIRLTSKSSCLLYRLLARGNIGSQTRRLLYTPILEIFYTFKPKRS